VNQREQTTASDLMGPEPSQSEFHHVDAMAVGGIMF
jgi:hypothetical protein